MRPIFSCATRPAVNQPAQMKRERGGRHVKTGLDIGDVEAGRSGPNQKPIDIQPGQIAQFGQATRGELAVHAPAYRKRASHYNYNPSFIVLLGVHPRACLE